MRRPRLRLPRAVIQLALLSLLPAAATPLQAQTDRLVAEETLRIGSADDTTYAFDWASSIRARADGTIWSAHTNEQRLRVWSPDGSLLRVIGRAGDGPGEFRSIGAFGWRADTLWAYDNREARMSFFDFDGAFLSSANIRFSVDGHAGPTTVQAGRLLADGTLAGSTSAPSHLVTTGEITEVHLLRLSRAGEVLNVIQAIPLESGTLEISNPRNETGPRSFSSQPFSERPLNVPLADGSGFVVVERPYHQEGREPRFSVALLNLDGQEVWRRWFTYVPRRVTAEEVDSIVAPLVSRATAPAGGGQFPAIFASPGAAEQVIRERLVLPDFHPPVKNVVAGRDGSLWLQRETPGFGDTGRWNVLDAEGRMTASLALPRRLRVQDADADHVWGTVTDEFDVPYIVRYRLRPRSR